MAYEKVKAWRMRGSGKMNASPYFSLGNWMNLTVLTGLTD